MLTDHGTDILHGSLQVLSSTHRIQNLGVLHRGIRISRLTEENLLIAKLGLVEILVLEVDLSQLGPGFLVIRISQVGEIEIGLNTASGTCSAIGPPE